MKQTLPWESAPGPIYHDVPAKPPKKWVQTGGWVLVAFLLLGSATATEPVIRLCAAVFAILYLLTMLTQQDTVVTERGLEIFFQMRVTTQYYFWPWGEMYAVTHEYDYRAPGKVILYFTRGDRTKKLYFPREYEDAILSLARAKNPGIRIYDGAKTRAADARKAEERKHRKKKK